MNIPERDYWYSDPDHRPGPRGRYLGADEALDIEDEEYATLQAEQLAAADVDWDAREMSD